MPKICISKFKKAQHIVEFALIAPFIIFFLGVVLEIALIVHTNYRFNASLYEAVSFMALNNKINVEKEETVKNIKEYAKILLKHRFAPYKNSLDTELVQAGDIDFIIGKYKYTSTFTIFNYMTGFEPDSYNFLTIIPVNSAVLRKNSFDLSDGNVEKLMDIYYNGYKNNSTEDIEGGENGDTEDSSPDEVEEKPDIGNENDEAGAEIEANVPSLKEENAGGKNTFDIQMPEVNLQ